MLTPAMHENKTMKLTFTFASKRRERTNKLNNVCVIETASDFRFFQKVFLADTDKSSVVPSKSRPKTIKTRAHLVPVRKLYTCGSRLEDLDGNSTGRAIE